MEHIIGVGVLVVLLYILGVSASSFFKRSSVPNWAKFNPRKAWGIAWVDGRPWLKKILINIFQGIFVIIIFFSRAIWTVMKAMFKFMAAPGKK